MLPYTRKFFITIILSFLFFYYISFLLLLGFFVGFFFRLQHDYIFRYILSNSIRNLAYMRFPTSTSAATVYFSLLYFAWQFIGSSGRFDFFLSFVLSVFLSLLGLVQSGWFYTMDGFFVGINFISLSFDFTLL